MRDAVAAATLASPPDVIVTVGGTGSTSSPRPASTPHQFAAHRAVLASHSGYLKALLTAAAAATSNAVTIAVPNVSPEAFAPLLTFMYTGYLDVNHENVYSVLLATHLLHMPRALDLCRAFLVQNQQQQSQASLPRHTATPTSLPPLVKPIPSRKMLPVLLGLGGFPPPPPPPAAPFWPPPTYHHTIATPPAPQLILPSADNSPFRSVLPTSIPLDIDSCRRNHEQLKLVQPPPPDIPVCTPTPQPIGNNTRRRPKSPLAIPSTSTSRRNILLRSASPPSPSSISPCPSGASYSSEDRSGLNDPPADRHKSKNARNQHQQQLPQKKHQQSSKMSPCKKQQPSDTSTHGATNSNTSKVIIDVACCDGPVRFHRVLNDNYGLTLDDILVNDPAADNMTHELPLQNNQESEHGPHTHKPAASSQSLSYPETGDEEDKKYDHNNQQSTQAEVSDERPKGETDQNTLLQQQQQQQQQQSLIDHFNECSGSQEADTSNLSEPQTSDRSTSNKKESSAPNLHDGNTSPSSASIASEKVSGSLETVYTCLYCNHTFKSHYCYQKHARRHINPVTIDLSRLAERLGTNKGVAVCKILSSEKEKVNGSGGVRREVRLLDMNVQYYPCKTCGSKFPSYYFVHKHRKMCHANEETESLVGSEESRSQSQTATSV